MKRNTWRLRRERGPYTRAIGLVITRSFGIHVHLTLWWFSISFNRRTKEVDEFLSAAREQLDRQS